MSNTNIPLDTYACLLVVFWETYFPRLLTDIAKGEP